LVQTCDGRATGVAEWPFERIETTARPAGAQRAALDELRAASAHAVKVLDAACPPDMPLTPIARLEIMENRLAATLRAIGIVGPAIETFYGTLSDEQKARFNPTGARSTAKRQSDDSSDHGERSPGGDENARICSDEQVPKFAELTIRHVEQVVRPTDAQRAALNDLKGASSRATETLRAACPTDPATTPQARLDAMRQRVGAMLEAVRTVRPALTSFYGALTDEQKARFNTMSARELP
jgi:hypothetical protein